ncbi:PTS sugar transporter subunit IIA [Propionispora vibrioides]|jgi:PTS system fructose-specific IIA component|uniref:PTS system IIA component, Fru family n=1 Tax=Propionispora vibrioides TaxID=112903 RepID=A0A1H8XHY8_9FIRM|nr:PTS sugar transporter subunit IIA [Propionispora vibrioides]SEP39367.1 PTS system IIA component, Fru family [Propionispora vibrioides]
MEQIITKDLLILDLASSTKEDVIKDMAKVIESEDRLDNLEGYLEQVFKREETFPTSVGFEVAIPHGKTDAVKWPTVAFSRLKNEVKWSNEESVKYVFLIAVPEKEAGNMHLQIIAQLSRKIMREEFREQLKNASEADELLKILTM